MIIGYVRATASYISLQRYLSLRWSSGDKNGLSGETERNGTVVFSHSGHLKRLHLRALAQCTATGWSSFVRSLAEKNIKLRFYYVRLYARTRRIPTANGRWYWPRLRRRTHLYLIFTALSVNRTRVCTSGAEFVETTWTSDCAKYKLSIRCDDYKCVVHVDKERIFTVYWKTAREKGCRCRVMFVAA